MENTQIVATHETAALMPAPANNTSLACTSVEDAFRIAELVASDGLYGIRRVSDAFVRIAAGAQLGVHWTVALAQFDLIDGKPSPRSKLIEAVVLRSPLCERLECLETSAEKAVYIGRRVGREDKVYEYSNADAIRDGLADKQNYKKNRPDMLRARACGKLVRMEWPEIATGLYSAEEMSLDGNAPGTFVPAASRVEPEPATDALDDWYAAIEAAATLDDLNALVPELGKLDDAAKAILRPAFAARRAALATPAPGYATRMAQATTIDELFDIGAELAAEPEDVKARFRDLFTTCQRALEAAQQVAA